MSYVWTPDSAANFLFPGYAPTTSTAGLFINSTQSTVCNDSTSAQTTVFAGLSNTTGPDRNFNFYCQGFPVTSQCVRIDIWEIFEYIPDTSGNNIVNLSPVRLDSSDVNVLAKTSPVHEVDSNTFKSIVSMFKGEDVKKESLGDSIERYSKPLIQLGSTLLKSLVF